MRFALRPSGIYARFLRRRESRRRRICDRKRRHPPHFWGIVHFVEAASRRRPATWRLNMSKFLAALGLSTALAAAAALPLATQAQAAMSYGGPGRRRPPASDRAGREGAVLLGRIQLLLVSGRLARPWLVLVRLRLEQRLRLGRRLRLARLARRVAGVAAPGHGPWGHGPVMDRMGHGPWATVRWAARNMAAAPLDGLRRA